MTLVAGDFNLTQQVIQQAPPGAQVSPLHQLPSLPPAFTGRDDELAELERKLTTEHATGATISGKQAGLQGTGGVGKTALATVLAHRLKARYPDAQIVVNLRGAGADEKGHYQATSIKPVTPAEAMQKVIHSFRPEAQLPEEIEALTPIYRSVLAEAGRVLLLLDNAANAEQVRPLLPPPNCLLLVTSRQWLNLDELEECKLDCLKPDKSEELLLKLAPRAEGHAKNLAQLCGHLPLALKAVGGIFKTQSLFTPEQLLERLRSGRDKLAPVEAAFQMSYELLTDELRRCWRLLAVFPASFDLRAAAAVWADGPRTMNLHNVQRSTFNVERSKLDVERSPGGEESEGVERARASMQSLLNASLVEWNEASNRFRLHELVRQFCEEKLRSSGLASAADSARTDRPEEAGGARQSAATEELAAQLRHARHYCDVGWEADALYGEGGEKMLRGLELFDRERTHIEAALELLAGPLTPAHTPIGREGARRTGEEENERATLIVSLVGAVAFTGALRFHPRQRIRWLESQREAATICKNRVVEGNAFGNLGNAYYELGEARKAIDYHKQQLTITREIGDRRGEGNALGSLGIDYADLGDVRKAVEFYEQRLAIALEIGDRRGQCNVVGNLGNAYLALGDASKAIEFHEQQLTISREIGDRRVQCNIAGNLGNAYFALGDLRKATELYEEQLIIAREIGDRRAEGKALGNLGTSCASLGDMGKAFEFYGLRLAIAQELGDRRGEGDVLGNFGVAYDKLGDPRRAIEFYDQRLVITREIGDRRGEGIALFNSALSLDKLGDRAQAIARAESALRILEAIEDPNAAIVRAQLAEWRSAPS